MRRLGDELTLTARHLAWLHATPKPPEGSKRAAGPARKIVSRLDAMKAQKVAPPMPPCTLSHIVTRWIEIGMVEGGGMAPAALRWSELVAWQTGTGIGLGTWELRTIHAMSVAYIAEGRRAEEETCPPPWHPPVTKVERDSEEARLRMLLG